MRASEEVIALCTTALLSIIVLFTFIPANEAGRELKVACRRSVCLCLYHRLNLRVARSPESGCPFGTDGRC